jgi:hypothetical protein
VLLCGHLEGFVEDLVIESLDRLIRLRIGANRIPRGLKWRQAFRPVQELAQIRDVTKFVGAMTDLINAQRQLFTGDRLDSGSVDPVSLVRDFANPTLDNIGSLLGVLGLTRRQIADEAFASWRTRAWVLAGIESLVAVRHEVAHGGSTSAVTQADVFRFASAVTIFGARLDNAVDVQLERLSAGPGTESAAGFRTRIAWS